MTVLADHVTSTPHCPAQELVTDALPACAGPRFRFRDENPLTGRSYARSRWEDLPYMIGLLVRKELRLTPREWDCLVASGSVPDVVGPREYTVPFSFRVPSVLPERSGRAPADKCGDCWGTGVEVDFDASMTGVVNALYLCFCVLGW